VVQEANRSWVQAVDMLRDVLPESVSEPQDDNFGLLMRTGCEVCAAGVVRLGETQQPTLCAELALADGRTLTLVSPHPPPPVTLMAVERQRAQFTSVAERINATGGPVLVVGDFNATPWASVFREFIGKTDLRNARWGRGIKPTWPTMLPAVCRIPIDHCLHNEDVVIDDFRLGPHIGSDHLPLIVDFHLAAEEPITPERSSRTPRTADARSRSRRALCTPADRAR
jgi:endonuclease/exonuclease/phosphatase (EEP) superfamily protein YafD